MSFELITIISELKRFILSKNPELLKIVLNSLVKLIS